jgi:hypothetical protein
MQKFNTLVILLGTFFALNSPLCAQEGVRLEYLQSFTNNSGEMQSIDQYEWYYFRGASAQSAEQSRLVHFNRGSAPSANVGGATPHGDNLASGFLVIASNVGRHFFYTSVDVEPGNGAIGLVVDMNHSGNPQEDVWRFAIRMGRNWYVSADSIQGRDDWRRYVVFLTPDSRWLPLRFVPQGRLVVGEEVVTFDSIEDRLTGAGIYGEPESNSWKRFDNFQVTSGHRSR